MDLVNDVFSGPSFGIEPSVGYFRQMGEMKLECRLESLVFFFFASLVKCSEPSGDH